MLNLLHHVVAHGLAGTCALLGECELEVERGVVHAGVVLPGGAGGQGTRHLLV